MFSKNKRIHTADFNSILKNGKNYHSPLFSYVVLRSDKPAFAVVASKKVSKLAVVRNNNKRRVRNALRSALSEKVSFVCIVFIKKNLKEVPYASILEELRENLQRFS